MEDRYPECAVSDSGLMGLLESSCLAQVQNECPGLAMDILRSKMARQKGSLKDLAEGKGREGMERTTRTRQGWESKAIKKEESRITDRRI